MLLVVCVCVCVHVWVCVCVLGTHQAVDILYQSIKIIKILHHDQVSRCTLCLMHMPIVHEAPHCALCASHTTCSFCAPQAKQSDTTLWCATDLVPAVD